jgi:predicted transcriptional regulator of viral defense system
MEKQDKEATSLMRANLKPLSKKQVEIVAWLEFYKRYFFTIKDIVHLFKNKKDRYNTIQRLIKKKRIVKLNKEKYALIPIKARIGKWSDEPFIVIDETLDGKDYYIGGWGAANYWRLTDQIPYRYDIYTTRRQGKYQILGNEIIFHRTTKRNINKNGCEQEINNHKFKILNKRATKKWMKSRS